MQTKPKNHLLTTQLLIPPLLYYLLIFLWSCFIVYHYLKVYPINLWVLAYFFSYGVGTGSTILYLINYFITILFVFIFLLSAFGIGRFFQEIFSLSFDSHSEKNILAIGLGFVFIIYWTLFFGWLGLLYLSVILVPILVGIFFGVKFVTTEKKQFSTSARKEKIGFLLNILLILVVISLIYVFIGALSPETFYDSLKYHLAVPKYWIQHHKIAAIPNFEYSFYPVNIHILYLVALMFGNEITAKLIHFVLGLLTAAMVFFWAKRYFSRQMSWLAVSIIFSVPFVLMIMWKTAIEMGLAFFETLAVICMLEFIFDQEHSKKWLVLSAIFCGTAIGGKYLSVYCFIALVIILFIQMIKEKISVQKTISTVMLFVLVCLSLPSPYLIRNYVKTGILTYPYTASLKKDVTVLNKSNEIEFTDPAKPERTLKNFLTLPWNIAMGKKTQEPLSGAVLLLFAPLPLFFRQINKKIKLLVYYVLVYYFCWFMVRTYFRYIIPFIPVCAIVFAYFISETKINQYVKQIILLVLILLELSVITFVVNTEIFTMNPWPIVCGYQSKLDYLSTQRPSYPNPYYQTLAWANKNLNLQAKILFLGECRAYYSDRKFLVQTVGDFNPLILWIKENKTVDGFYHKLRKEGVTHILLNVPEAKRLAGYDILHFEPKEFKIWCEFWNKYVKEIYRDVADISLPDRGIYSLKKQAPDWWQQYASNPMNYVYLYEIMSEEEAEKPHQPPYNFFLHKELYSQERWEKLKPVIDEILADYKTKYGSRK